MRKFANLFFFVYLADGVVSLAHELLTLFLQVEPVSGLRNMVAILALLLALPLYVSLGIDRRLPKGVIIPQVLFVVWVAFGAWPVAHSGGTFGLLAALVQTLLGLLPFILYAGTGGGNRLLPEQRFQTDSFGMRNTLVFFLTHLLLLPLVFVFLAISVLAQYANQQTAGFMRLGSDGIHLQDRVYSRAGKNIRLTGMIHIGEQDFYRALVDSVNTTGTVILAEGVTDQDNLLNSRFDYDNMAQLLGLTPQGEIEFAGRLIEESDLGKLSAEDSDDPEPHILRADTDLNRFSPLTVEFINMLGTHLFNSDSWSQGMAAYDAWARQHITPETTKVIFGDLLDARNEIVITWLDRVLPLYDTVMIPWGALHMPGIEAAVRQRGFKLTSSRERLSVDFSRLPVAALLQKLAEPSPAGTAARLL